MNNFYSDPSFLAIVFFVGTAVGALFNSLYRALVIRRLKHEFIQDVLADLEKANAGSFTAAPLHWNSLTAETARVAVSASRQVDAAVGQERATQNARGPVTGDSTI
jgi:hypothetical protein